MKFVYAGEYDDAWVMQQVGNNMKEKRSRLRKAFGKAKRKESVPVANGCTLESWKKIYESFASAKYQSKSCKCTAGAEARTRLQGFTHKLGPHGVIGLVTSFVSFSHLFT